MRRKAILIVLIALNFSLSMFGQEQKADLQQLKQLNVFLNARNMSLERALSTLSKNYNVMFIYRASMLREKNVNLYLDFVPFEEVLQKLFYPHGLTYFFMPDGKVVVASASRESWTMTGRITDAETGEPLTGVNVYIENTYLGAATDKTGKYRINDIPFGAYRLFVRMMGYQEIQEYIFHEGVKILQRDFSLKPEALRMKEVRVVARREEYTMKKDVSTYSLNPRNISVIPSYGETDIFRSIQFIPGVTMTSEFKSQLYIRGGNSDQNLVLLDGGIVYNPFHFSGILSAFDMDAIDEVELFAGGFRAEYGSRLSSVLDIKTRKGADKFSGKLHVSPISTKGMIEGPLWKWGDYLFTGRKSYVNTIAKKMGGSVEPDFYDGIGRLEVRPTWKDRIILSGFYGYDAVRMQKENSAVGITSTNMSRAFNYYRTFSNSFSTSLRATYGKFENEMPQALKKDEPQKNAMEDKSADLKMEFTLMKGLSFKVGANYHEMWIKYRTADPIITELIIDERLSELAFFIQSRIKIKKKWQLETGIRATRYDENRPFVYEPRFNLQFDLYNFLTFKGAYGHFSQNLVTIYNENDNYNPVDIWLPPDPNLPVATADHVILGCMYNTRDLIISVEGYWKKYHHLTHYNRERIDPNDPYFIQGQGDAIGLDLSMQLIKEKWQVWVSYSLAKATKELPVQYPEPGIDKFAPRYDRRHNFNVSYEYKPLKDFVLSVRFNIGSGLPFSFMIGAYNRWETWVIDPVSDYSSHNPEELLRYLAAIKSERDAFRFPVYHRLDVSVKYSYKWGHFTFNPYFQVLNFYNQPNVLYYDFQGKPHTSLPIMPMAGLEIVW